MADDMTPVFELAGYCAAEALLNLSGRYETRLKPGEAALLPSVVVQNPAGKRARTIFDDLTRETFEKIEGAAGPVFAIRQIRRRNIRWLRHDR